MARARRIRTQPSYDNGLRLKGWLFGKETTLDVWHAMDDGHLTFIGDLVGQKLYRLAKAIVRQFEDSAHG